MANSTYYKYYIQKLISNDPSPIVRKRSIKTPDDFGGYTTTQAEIPYIIRIYKRRSVQHYIVDVGVVGGNSMTAAARALIMYGDDILEGDTIQVGNVIYKVTLVVGYTDICKQADLEMIT